MTENQSLV